MSTNEADSRCAVNKRIAEAGSNNVTAMVEAGISSEKKRAENRAQKEAQRKKEVTEKAATEADAVRTCI